jgi:putative inorganic carbon (HCO3(-)) transporter
MTTIQTFRNQRVRVDTAVTKSAGASVPWSREWFYFTLVIAGWCFTPLLRRLLDWHNGYYNPIQITSVIPFLLTMPLALVAFRSERIARLSPPFKLFAWVWVCSFGYGLLLAVALGNTSAAIYASIQYLVPMLVGIWIAGSDLGNLDLMRRLSTIILTAAGVVSLYGLVQFVEPSPWDALWINGGQYTSMGQPVPFGLRIFSTLNSAGPAADFFAIVILFALPFCRLSTPWIWPFMLGAGSALMLTLVRASWVALVVGVVVYMITTPRRFRTLPFIALYALALVFLVASLPGMLGAGSSDSDVVTSRIATLGDVNHDDSAVARSGEIQNSIEQALQNPIGQGLGTVGAASALSSNPSSPNGNNLDSGYLARLLELGWAGFAGYLFVVLGSLLTMVVSLLRPVPNLDPASRDVLVNVAAAAAVCAALVWADAAGDSHLGLDGLLFWIALGIGLRRRAPGLPLSGESIAK